MIISKISTQKKNKNRYNIYQNVDGHEEYMFSIHEDLLIRHHIRKGLTLSEEQVQELKKQDAIYQYYTRSINFLSYRMRAKSEVESYLKEKGASQEDLEPVIQKLEEENLLDDLAFSQAYVRTKINTSSKGPNQIRQELIQKKIPNEYIEEAMPAYTKDEEIKKATKLIEKKLNVSRKKSFKQQLLQLKQSLLQKGFTQDAIENAINQVDFPEDEEAEMEALRAQGEKAWQKYARKHDGFVLKQKVQGALYQKGFPFELIQQFMDEKEEEE